MIRLLANRYCKEDELGGEGFRRGKLLQASSSSSNSYLSPHFTF